MNLIWNVLGKPLAMLGGRSWAEMRERPAGDCDKSVTVGLMCLLSIAIIFVGHYLFWGNFPNVAAWAVEVAAGVALVFALIYRAALRGMEAMSAIGKAVVLMVLSGLMGVNAMLAGHELVLLAFRPQVEAQAKLSAATGVTAYASAVETSLGLPQLRSNSSELDNAIGAAMAERARTPDNVQQLQQQARSCEADATRLYQRIPADADEPGYATARSAWREKRSQCAVLVKQATSELQQHRTLADQQLKGLNQSRDRVRQSLDDASTQHENQLKRDTPTLTASATTGFARHTALWSSVAANTIPAWAAYGLMFAVLAIDSFSFLIKLLVRNDKATVDRMQDAAADHLHEQLHGAMVAQQRRLLRRVVKNAGVRAEKELQQVAEDSVLPSVMQDLEQRAFDRAAQATSTAQRSAGKPSLPMLGRLARMARSIRDRAPGGVAAAGAAG